AFVSSWSARVLDGAHWVHNHRHVPRRVPLSVIGGRSQDVRAGRAEGRLRRERDRFSVHDRAGIWRKGHRTRSSVLNPISIRSIIRGDARSPGSRTDRAETRPVHADRSASGRSCRPAVLMTKLMETYIALFRGINVGGSNLLPKPALRLLLEKEGCVDVRTYIQSGNAIYRSARSDPAGL